MKRFALILGTTLFVLCSALLLFTLPAPSYANGSATATTAPQPTLAPPPTAAPSPTPITCQDAPLAPRLITPSNGSILNTSTVLLKWSKVPCQPTYRLEIRRKSRSGHIFVNNTFRKKAFIATLTTRGRYVWSVTACTENGCRSSEWRKFHINIPAPTRAPGPQPTAVPPTWPPQPTAPPAPTAAPPPTWTPAAPYTYGFVRATCEHAAASSVYIIVYSAYADPDSQLAGARVIASYAPDSPAFSNVVGVTNANGEFQYVMSLDGDPPYVGDVYAWVVDSNDNRISPVAGPVRLNGKPPTRPASCWLAKFYFAGGPP